MARPDKVAAVEEIAENFRGASASVVTEYRGLTMSQLTTLRRSLGDGATYRVAKNTLVKRAAQKAGIEGLDDLLVGPTAITFIQGEPVEAAKALREFAKTNQGLVIKGGFMDGRPLTVDEVNRLGERADADLGPGEVGEDGEGLVERVAGLADPADDAGVGLVCAVGHVEAEDIDPRAGEGPDGIGRGGGRPYRRDDFGTHGVL